MGIVGDGGVLVDPPGCKPANFGLLSVAEVEDRTDGHWETGIEYDLLTCDDLFVVTACPPGDVPGYDKTPDGGVVSTAFGDPFTVVASYKCSVPGAPVEDAWRYAGERLSRGEAKTVERTFWTGKDVQGQDVRRSLGNNDEVVDLTPSGGAADITAGVAMLEQWAAENLTCAPVLHASRMLGVYFGEHGLVERDGSSLTSHGTGTDIVIGGGYLLNGPEGGDPDEGEAWIYITGGIKVIRGPVFFTPPRGENGAAVNRSLNDITVFAERTYAIEQDCGVAAVRVVLQSCCGT
jgi:hypothetical protein